MKKKHPVDDITALKAGCDRFTITFGNGRIFVDDIYKRAIKKLESNSNVDIYTNSNKSGYEVRIKIQFPLSVSWIYIGNRNTKARPYKLEFAGSRMSDDDYMQLRSILIKVFGKSVLGDIYDRGNITSVEFHIDCSGINAGDLVPCNYALKWMVVGKGCTVESIYWGDKLFKSYNKSEWFDTRLFTSQAQSHLLPGFVYPSEVINRLERTVRNFKGATNKIGFSPQRLVEEGYSPFDGVKFIDTRKFSGNMHFPPTDLMLLRIIGQSAFIGQCENAKQATEVKSIIRIISSATRIGFGEYVNKMIKKSIQNLEFLSQDFNVKAYKRSIDKPLIKYHHLGFVTRELLDLLYCGNDDSEPSVPSSEIQTYLKKVFGTSDASEIAGKAVTEKVAHHLLSLVQVVDTG